MRKKIEALIEVRKMIALLFSGLFVYMAVTGRIDSAISMSLITLVIGYYFGKSTALDKPE